MKPWFDFGINNVPTVKDLARFSAVGFKNLYDILNKNFTFSDNAQCTIVKDQSFTNGVEKRIDHTLGVVPLGYLVVSKNAAAHIYDGTSIWNEKSIYLISSADVIVDVIILGG